MIEIGMNGIVKNFGFNNVLHGANMEIMTGERVGLAGRNGSGKSTILKLISGEETAQKGMVSIRRNSTVGYLEQIPQLFHKEMLTKAVLWEALERPLRLEAAMRELEAQMAEESDSERLSHLLEEYERVQAEFIALDGYSMEETYQKAVKGFGLTELLERPFHVLSGGQKTVVKLACTVLSQPDILLLDEPTNHLDVKTLEWFEGYLAKYRGTVVIVSHDRYFLDRVTTKTVLLEGGTCESFSGNYSESVKERERQLLVEFEQYKNQQKKVSAMKAAIKRFRDWGIQGDNEKFMRKAKELEKRLDKMDIMEKPQIEQPKVALHFSGDRTGREVLRLQDYGLDRGGLPLLDGAEFTLYEKDKACLMGDNGTGKTSLLLTVLGMNSDYRGKITISPGARIGYIPQEIRFENAGDSLLEAFRREYPCTEGEARDLLARSFFCGDAVYKRAESLSGGEKVLLKLTVLMQRQVNFLILDEPTNHIDIETREVLEDALADFKGTILFVSHDRYFINQLATRLLEIQEQDIRSFDGNYDDYRRVYPV